MSPLRIFIIGVLLYIAYRLIVGGGSGKKKKIDKNMGNGPEYPTEDVLVEDPICNSLVPKQQAVTLEHRGETVHFCSEKCRNIFIAEHNERRGES